MNKDNAFLITTCTTAVVILVAFFLFLLMLQKQDLQYKQIQHQASKASWTQEGN